MVSALTGTPNQAEEGEKKVRRIRMAVKGDRPLTRSRTFGAAGPVYQGRPRLARPGRGLDPVLPSARGGLPAQPPGSSPSTRSRSVSPPPTPQAPEGACGGPPKHPDGPRVCDVPTRGHRFITGHHGLPPWYGGSLIGLPQVPPGALSNREATVVPPPDVQGVRDTHPLVNAVSRRVDSTKAGWGLSCGRSGSVSKEITRPHRTGDSQGGPAERAWWVTSTSNVRLSWHTVSHSIHRLGHPQVPERQLLRLCRSVAEKGCPLQLARQRKLHVLCNKHRSPDIVHRVDIEADPQGVIVWAVRRRRIMWTAPDSA